MESYSELDADQPGNLSRNHKDSQEKQVGQSPKANSKTATPQGMFNKDQKGFLISPITVLTIFSCLMNTYNLSFLE